MEPGTAHGCSYSETAARRAVYVPVSRFANPARYSAMRRLTSLVEPLVILGMGSFVGFVVLSILLPIFQANSLVK